jgi:glucose-6-phosphate isomerase
VCARTLGLLIALFERAVGLYASLVNINAYDQPGVQAGKLAADAVLAVQSETLAFLSSRKGESFTAEAIAAQLKTGAKTAAKLELDELAELVFKVCEHLAANPDKRVAKKANTPFFTSTYTHLQPNTKNTPTNR